MKATSSGAFDKNGSGPQTAIGVGIDGWRVTGEELKEELQELGLLASTYGAKMEKVIVQERSKPDPSTLIGKGKVQEIKEISGDYDLIIFNELLKPAQHNTLRKEFKDKDVQIIDRTDLILDIFSQRAETKDAKLQVELEIKERDIRQRIDQLQEKLEDIRGNRQVQRKTRDHIPEVSLVGYTNAGKSTLLNTLSNAEARQEEELFATLDTKTRRVHLEADRYFLLTDTVGFIKRMPDKLMEAFKATMEEVSRSDLLLHVVDLNSERVDKNLETVTLTLEQLGFEDIPRFRVFNKIDCVDDEIVQRYRNRFPDAYFVSAETGEGLTDLKEDIYRYFLDHNQVQRPDYAQNIPLEGSITA
ncbi:MAG: GTPase HflX [bacterium]